LQVAERGLHQLPLTLAGVGQWGAHAEHAPSRGPAERKEEQHPGPPDEGMRGTVLQPAVDLEVAERESVGIAAALERYPCALADAAVRAVAADQVARPHLLAAPVPVAKRAADLLLTGCERDQFDAALDLDAPFGQVLVQHRFGLGLRDEEQERGGGALAP